MAESKKVIILAPYSYPSACGVWSRAFADAKALKAEGYEVSVFTSNIIKGTNQTSSKYEEYEGIPIYRFRVWFKIGGNAMFWFFINRFLKKDADIVHTHVYRHPHSLQAFILSKLLGKKVILTTHAPFEKDPRRSIIIKIFDRLYDILIGWWELRFYDRVIRISNWEDKYLQRLGKKDSILIPNGIAMKFLENQPVQERDKPFHKVLYMGRVDPVKRIEWLIDAARQLPDVDFKVHGPLQYYSSLNSDIRNFQLVDKKYNHDEYIKELSQTDIYAIMSIREAQSFTILEAMSQGAIAISSPSNGPKEIIEDGVNGFIVKNVDELVQKINFIYNNWDKMRDIRVKAVQKAEEYSELKMNMHLTELYKSI